MQERELVKYLFSVLLSVSAKGLMFQKSQKTCMFSRVLAHSIAIQWMILCTS